MKSSQWGLEDRTLGLYLNGFAAEKNVLIFSEIDRTVRFVDARNATMNMNVHIRHPLRSAESTLAMQKIAAANNTPV